MTFSIEPPVRAQVTDRNMFLTVPWNIFFSDLINGDSGTTFTPVATNLTSVGTPTLAGKYYDNSGFIDIYITITPATSTTAVAGSTYFDSPVSFQFDALCSAMTSTSSATGSAVAAQSRIYVPSWTGTTTAITINCRVKK